MGAPSGTVTFLFTDIEGSTRLWDEEPEMMRVALERHDAMVRAAIRDAGGVVFATGGDGFAAAFSRAGDALAASVAIQRALTRERWPNGVDLRVRVGVHTGEALERDGDYFGSAVNTASRLMTLSGPGQVLCSQATASLVDARGEWDLVDLGPVSLRGLASPVRAFGVIADGVRPPTALARDRPTGNLPRMSTEFVGREGELREVRRLLRPGRCLTLTGTGGVGKTRLAVEVASVAADAFSDGAWMVDLAAVSEPALVAAAAAQALLLRIPEGGAPLDAVVAAIAARRMVLVIDNCEHLLDACADFVERVTEVCSGVAVMATSREPLGLPGEQVCRVASLDPSRDAIELFVDRVRLVDPAFAPTAADLDTIQEMATRLDGIPLAIELAAARVRSLGLAGVLARLDDRFSLLRAGRRGRLERHQTLRATVAWSYQLLSQDEAAAFDGCAVFADGFDIDAARAVWGGGHDELEVVDRLEALVDKSMVTTDPSGRGARYHVLETLRQFAEERLFETGRLAEVSERHARHYVAVAEAAAAQFETPAEADAIAIFREEWGNLRTAFTW
ncbi:MAG TPA: adenylate/guanylate cyclase domain-containing protein, partial [Acidimicrobiales bacterium]|nr:adenylate/guanylate cyclase domain-containing protein [Acidimicrobiales bacterium]